MQPLYIGDIVEENGKTIRQNKMALTHNIPLGTFVEVEYDENDASASEGQRLYVQGHNRDCDGTPLYSLTTDYRVVGESFDNDKRPTINGDLQSLVACHLWHMRLGTVQNGLPEQCLKVIRTAEEVAERFKKIY
jgi:hypothetical protein